MASGPQEETTPDGNKECFVMDEDKNEIIFKLRFSAGRAVYYSHDETEERKTKGGEPISVLAPPPC